MLWNKRVIDNSQTSVDKGSCAESFAIQYLCDQGLSFISKNFHTRKGEIDLIMKDGDIFVFVEVKYRKSDNFGGAISAIPQSKQLKIKHSITFYLHQAGLNEYNTPCRIDVVALVGDITQPQVTWIKNAF